MPPRQVEPRWGFLIDLVKLILCLRAIRGCFDMLLEVVIVRKDAGSQLLFHLRHIALDLLREFPLDVIFFDRGTCQVNVVFFEELLVATRRVEIVRLKHERVAL